MSHSYSINGLRRRPQFSAQWKNPPPSDYFSKGSIVTLDEGFTFIRGCKMLKTLGLWWLPSEIIEGIIENPVGTDDLPTFLDTVVDFLESEEQSPKIAKNFDIDIYNVYESISMSLDTLQDLVDLRLTKVFGSEYFSNYKVVRWLNPTTAIIGVNQIDPIR